MFSRVTSKDFLKNLKVATLSHLEQTRIFKDPTFNQYYLKLIPHFYNKVDALTNESNLVIERAKSILFPNNTYIDTIQNLNILKNSKTHKQSLQKEINRKKDIIENKKLEIKVYK